MTFDEYWTLINSLNPIPDGGSVRMEKESFKKQLKSAYDAGLNSKSTFEQLFGRDR